MSEERKYTGFAAIYQLEQEKLKRERARPPETPPAVSEQPVEEPSNAAPEAEAPIEEPRTHATGEPNLSENTAADSTSHMELAPAVSNSARKLRPAPARMTPARASKRSIVPKTRPRTAPLSDQADSPVEAHALRWKQIYRLNKGEVNVMRVMFGLSHGQGTDVCHIRVREVAEAANLKKRQCQYVIRRLEALGFLELLEAYDPFNRLGVKYRVNLKPLHIDSE